MTYVPRGISIVLLSLAACGESKPDGLLVRIRLDDAIKLQQVRKLELTVSRDSGFANLDATVVEGIAIHAEDRNGDGRLDAVLTWNSDPVLSRETSVRLGLSDDTELRFEAWAENGAGLIIATGATGSAESSGQDVVIDVACLLSNCAPREVCNGKDDDENEIIDDGQEPAQGVEKNACGGVCELTVEPFTPCDFGGVGKLDDAYLCTDLNRTDCTELIEICGDHLDNDLDDMPDEECPFALTWGGADANVIATRLALAPDGWIAVHGGFSGTVDFDPGTSEDPLSPGKGLHARFISLFDPDGSYRWTYSLSTTSIANTYSGDLVIGDDGEVWVVGRFFGETDFDPGPGEAMRTSGAMDAFLLQLSPEGEFVSVRTWGGPAYDDALGLAFALDQGFWVAGMFSDTVDFAAGDGPPDEITSLGATDVFVTRLSPDGDYDFTRTIGGVGTQEVYDLSVGTDGSVMLVGDFADTLDLDPGGGENLRTSAGATDVFVLRLDEEGQHVAGTTWGDEDFDAATHVAIAADGSSVVGTQHGPAGARFSCITKMTEALDTTWTGCLGVSTALYSLALDEDGADEPGVLLGGDFEGTVDFDIGIEGEALRETAAQAGFVLRVFFDGAFDWVRVLGDASDATHASATGVSRTSDGLVLASGYFQNSLDFGLDKPDVRTAQGNWDGFLLKWLPGP